MPLPVAVADRVLEFVPVPPFRLDVMVVGLAAASLEKTGVETTYRVTGSLVIDPPPLVTVTRIGRSLE